MPMIILNLITQIFGRENQERPWFFRNRGNSKILPLLAMRILSVLILVSGDAHHSHPGLTGGATFSLGGGWDDIYGKFTNKDSVDMGA